jgi:hypothetical protein
VQRGDELVVLVEGMNMDTYPVSLRIQDLRSGYDAGGVLFNLDEPSSGGAKSAAVRPQADIPINSQPSASCPLHNGVNKMYAASDGLVYIMYMSSNYKNAPEITVHFASGRVNGYFDGRKHTQSDWTRLLNAAEHEHFDVIGKYAHLTCPTASFKQYTRDRGPELISLYDKLVYLEWKFMGLLSSTDESFIGIGKVENIYAPSGYGGRQENHIYLHVDYKDGVFMYASSYHTGYHISTMGTVCNVEALLNEGCGSGHRDQIWGLAHEVGHVNQTRPGFRWGGMAEVTNNLHSIYVQTHLNDDECRRANTRLQMESMGADGYVNRYEKAANVYMVEKKEYNYTGNDMDVFCKLVPMWQLHLYLTEVLGKPGAHGNGFYEDIYEAVRKRTTDNPDPGWQQMEYVKLVCEKAELNLEDFFSLYGFLSPAQLTGDDYGDFDVTITQKMVDDVKTYIRKWPKPDRVKEFQYITDENVTLFKNSSGVVAYELRQGSETGDIKRVYLNTGKPVTLNLTNINVPSGQKLYSVDVNGNRIFIR